MSTCKLYEVQDGCRLHIQPAETTMLLPIASSGIHPAFCVWRLLPHTTGSIHSGKKGTTASSNKLNIMLVCRPIVGIWHAHFLQQGPIQGEQESQEWDVLSSAFFVEKNVRSAIPLWLLSWGFV